jgi:hypothetical protein
LAGRSHAMNTRLRLQFSWGGEHGGGVLSIFALNIRVYYIVFD